MLAYEGHCRSGWAWGPSGPGACKKWPICMLYYLHMALPGKLQDQGPIVLSRLDLGPLRVARAVQPCFHQPGLLVGLAGWPEEASLWVTSAALVLVGFFWLEENWGALPRPQDPDSSIHLHCDGSHLAVWTAFPYKARGMTGENTTTYERSHLQAWCAVG